MRGDRRVVVVEVGVLGLERAWEGRTIDTESEEHTRLLLHDITGMGLNTHLRVRLPDGGRGVIVITGHPGALIPLGPPDPRAFTVTGFVGWLDEVG